MISMIWHILCSQVMIDAMDAMEMSEEDLLEEIVTQERVMAGEEVEEDDEDAEEDYFEDGDYDGAEVLYNTGEEEDEGQIEEEQEEAEEAD